MQNTNLLTGFANRVAETLDIDAVVTATTTFEDGTVIKDLAPFDVTRTPLFDAFIEAWLQAGLRAL